MSEENNAPATPPPPPAPEQSGPSAEEQEAAMRAELAKARSRSKVLTVLAVALGTILVIAAGVGYVIYSKISAAKENFEEVFRAMPMPEGMTEQQNRMLAGQGVYSSTDMPASTLGLFSGGVPGAAPVNMSQAEVARVEQAIAKYTERPVMKEFMEEIKRNPEVAEAMAKAKGGNPMAIFAVAQNSKGLEKVMMKYATRPEFLKTMMELANDPALKSMANAMPGVSMPAMPQGQPAAMPVLQGAPGGDQPEDSDGDGEMTFDPTAISGARTTQPAAAPKTKRVPSPVDNGQ